MINLALIGVGKWGKNYLSTIKSFPNCQIKYVCSKTIKTLDGLDKDLIKTTDYKDLFKYQDIDGVIIASPSSTHYKIAKEFLKKGFNLLIEKPVSLSYKEALELKELKKESKVLIGHIYLFDPAFIKTREIIPSLGKILHVSYSASSNLPKDPALSVLWEYGPHPISLALDIFKKDPTQVKAYASKSYDFITIKLKFDNDIQAFVKIDWSSTFKLRELTIFGSKATLVYNDLQEKRLTLFENNGPKKYPSYDHRLPLEKELDEFIEAISTPREVKKSDLDFGVRVTKLLEIAEQSIKKDGEVINV